MNTAFVKIWGELAGAVAWDPKTGLASFEYNTKFKRLNWDLSPIKMPIGGTRKVYSFAELRTNKNATVDTF
jgi:serine/threonine-protein kinase HipA